MENVRIMTEGDSSLLIAFKQEISPEVNAQISSIVKLIRQQKTPGIVDMIPAFASLLINYNPEVISYEALKKRLEDILKMDVDTETSKKRVYQIPVLYGGEFGPDLKTIADHAGLSEQEVIDIHTGTDYLIYMLGFLPGFVYLGGLDKRLEVPRLDTPRVRIGKGAVGIGGNQTGIYPMDSPGGWRLIGGTPVDLYDPEREDPVLLRAGEYIRFVPISIMDYYDIRQEILKGTYSLDVIQE